jgi:hypothetical protein
MLVPFKITVNGARIIDPAGQPPDALFPTRLLAVDMPPADPKATGPILKRSEWATKVITVPLGYRLR